MTIELVGGGENTARIVVIGVGGGGGNAVTTMIRAELTGVDFVVVFRLIDGELQGIGNHIPFDGLGYESGQRHRARVIFVVANVAKSISPICFLGGKFNYSNNSIWLIVPFRSYSFFRLF